MASRLQLLQAHSSAASSSQGAAAQAIDLGDLAGSPKSASANKELVGDDMAEVIEGAASSNNPGDEEGTL